MDNHSLWCLISTQSCMSRPPEMMKVHIKYKHDETQKHACTIRTQIPIFTLVASEEMQAINHSNIQKYINTHTHTHMHRYVKIHTQTNTPDRPPAARDRGPYFKQTFSEGMTFWESVGCVHACVSMGVCGWWRREFSTLRSPPSDKSHTNTHKRCTHTFLPNRCGLNGYEWAAGRSNASFYGW